MNNIDYTKKAVQILDGPTKAAKKIGVTRATIYLWLKKGVTDDYCARLASASGLEADKLRRPLPHVA